MVASTPLLAVMVTDTWDYLDGDAVEDRLLGVAQREDLVAGVPQRAASTARATERDGAG